MAAEARVAKAKKILKPFLIMSAILKIEDLKRADTRHRTESTHHVEDAMANHI